MRQYLTRLISVGKSERERPVNKGPTFHIGAAAGTGRVGSGRILTIQSRTVLFCHFVFSALSPPLEAAGFPPPSSREHTKVVVAISA